MIPVAIYSLLILTPGAWLSFAPKLHKMDLTMRFLLAFVLSPFVIFIQFYIIRSTGLNFDHTIAAILILNCPVLYFIKKRCTPIPAVSITKIMKFLLVCCIPLAFLAIKYHDVELRAYTGHGWMHSDTMYMLANGLLLPEEADLAGIAHAYPWVSHLYQSMLSRILDSPPVASYHITNILWLLALYIFLHTIVKRFGGDYFSRRASVIWLSFGVNAVGYMFAVKPLRYLVPSWSDGNYPIVGDERYSPWVEKYFYFSAMPLGLSIYMAALYIAITHHKRDIHDYTTVYLLGLLCSSMGIIYPILFPATLGIVAAVGIATLVDRQLLPSEKIQFLTRLFVSVILACAITYSYLEVLSQDRVNHAITISSLAEFSAKIAQSLVVLSPLLLGVIFAFPYCWREHRPQTIILLISGGISIALHWTFVLVWQDEYKFVFTTAISLVVFPTVAFQNIFTAFPRLKTPVFVVITFFLLVPFAHKMLDRWPYVSSGPRLSLDLSGFDLRLATSESERKLYDDIRNKTDTDTILIALKTEFHLPTLTQRSMYVSPYKEQARIGVNMPIDPLLKVLKGFSPDIIASRRATIHAIYNAKNTAALKHALDDVRKLERPMAILIDLVEDQQLYVLLSQMNYGDELYHDNSTSVWYIRISPIQAPDVY